MKRFIPVLIAGLIVAGSIYLANTNPMQPENQSVVEIEAYLNTFSAHTFQSSKFHTTITFVLPEEALVSVKVYNSDGHMVALLVHEKRDPGLHQAIFDTHILTPGTYRSEVSALFPGGVQTIEGVISVNK